MTVYFLGIGSNVNAEQQCRRMISTIDVAFGPIKASELVITKAVGIDAPDYVNGVVYFESDTSIGELKQWCKALEKRLGRDRGHNLCAADIDLLLSLDRDNPQPMEALISQINEPWFRPLLSSLLSENNLQME